MGILEAVKKIEKERARYEGLQEGLEQGSMQKSYEVVKNLIQQLALSDEQIAQLSGTTTEFVQKVRRELDEKEG